MLKNIFRKILLKLFEVGNAQFKNKQQRMRQVYLNSVSMISSDNTDIGDEAIISNNQNDKLKITIGKGSTIEGHLLIYKHGGEIKIGDHVFIGPGCRIWSAKRIHIGNRVLIAHNVNIHDNNAHPLDSVERHKDFLHIKSDGLQPKINLREQDVIIEDDVWIGFNSTILKGVRIGKGAIIGACTIITEDVPEYAVVVGNPPRILKYVD